MHRNLAPLFLDLRVHPPGRGKALEAAWVSVYRTLLASGSNMHGHFAPVVCNDY